MYLKAGLASGIVSYGGLVSSITKSLDWVANSSKDIAVQGNLATCNLAQNNSSSALRADFRHIVT